MNIESGRHPTIRITRDNDYQVHLLPSLSVSCHKLQDYSRDYFREVFDAVITHQVWIKVCMWRFQRLICISLNLT